MFYSFCTGDGVVELLHLLFKNDTDNSVRTTPGSARKRKATSSPINNSPLTKFVKSTPSSGVKRPPKPKIAKADTPEEPKVATKNKVAKGRTKKVQAVQYTVESVLLEWSASTEYGISFRGLSSEEQLAEVAVLNKSSAKGMRHIVKNNLLAKEYKLLIGEKMRLYFQEHRDSMASMMHAAHKVQPGPQANPTFLSVGEWVEVDADRTPGYNSEGGIGVITGVVDGLADVK